MDENSIYSSPDEQENETVKNETAEMDEVSVPSDDAPVVPVVKRENSPAISKITVVMCVLFALVGAVIGGVITGVILNRSYDDSQAVIEEIDETTTLLNSTEITTQQQIFDETTTALSVAETTTIVSGTVTSLNGNLSEDKTLSAKEIYADNVESVVGIEVSNGSSTGSGTGFIISEEGYIVTNYHVVSGANKYVVTLYDNSSYDATLVGYEDSNDLAILKIDAKRKIRSVVYGGSSELEVGDPVYVIGNPLGDLTYTLTDGIVSALNRLIATDDMTVINMFQTNAAINSGNSGGPVFDEHGYVVGIACAKYASSSIEGLSFCIPIDDVRSMIDEIINIGYVSGKACLGVSVCDKEIVSYGFIQAYRSIEGAKIVAIGAGSAAEKYGLQTGDIITAIGVESVTTVSALKTILSNYRSGDVTIVKFIRNGAEMSVSLILDEYEPHEPRTNYSYVYDL